MSILNINIPRKVIYKLISFSRKSFDEQVDIVLEKPLTEYKLAQRIDQVHHTAIVQPLEKYIISRYRLIRNKTSEISLFIEEENLNISPEKIIKILNSNIHYSTIRDVNTDFDFVKKWYKPLMKLINTRSITDELKEDFLYKNQKNESNLSQESIEHILHKIDEIDEEPNLSYDKLLRNAFNDLQVSDPELNPFLQLKIKGPQVFEKQIILLLKETIYHDRKVNWKQFMRILLYLNESLPFLFTMIPDYYTEDDSFAIKKTLENFKRKNNDALTLF